MKGRVVGFALLLAMSVQGLAWAQSFRLVYGSGVRGEIEPCG